QHLVDRGVGVDIDLRVLLRPVDHDPAGPELVAPVEHVDLRREAGEVARLLEGRVAAAHDRDLLVAEEEPVARRTRRAAAAAKPGRPGAVATAGPPKSMARLGRGAGATGAPTSMSFEKSIARPPNEGAAGGASSTEVSVAAPGVLPFLFAEAGIRTDAPTRSA